MKRLCQQQHCAFYNVVVVSSSSECSKYQNNTTFERKWTAMNGRSYLFVIFKLTCRTSERPKPHHIEQQQQTTTSSAALFCIVLFFLTRKSFCQQCLKALVVVLSLLCLLLNGYKNHQDFPPNLFLLQTPPRLSLVPFTKNVFCCDKRTFRRERESCNINKQDFSLPSNCCCLSQVRKFHSQMTELYILSIEILCLHTFADWIPPEMGS